MLWPRAGIYRRNEFVNVGLENRTLSLGHYVQTGILISTVRLVPAVLPCPGRCRPYLAAVLQMITAWVLAFGPGEVDYSQDKDLNRTALDLTYYGFMIGYEFN